VARIAVSGRCRGAVPRVRLERAGPARQGAFLLAVRRSRRLHAKWDSPPATPAAYRRYVQRLQRPAHYLGYYAFSPHAGRGLMREGLALVLDEAFRRLGLHRLEANIQPENGVSRRLVRGLGFRREGFSPRYLRIAGRWRDHERWAILREEWPGARTALDNRPGRNHARRRSSLRPKGGRPPT
jgi:ribosomal-protein-alanine N-acetyltransferase